jgi:peptide/nickel transport system ATP-binding protein
VDRVSLEIARGETVALVGESGSGKTSVGSAILGLAPVSAGSILLGGTDITHASPRSRRALSIRLQVVFQDPYSSLNPSRTIGATLLEALHARSDLPRAAQLDRVHTMLERVGLPADASERFPGHFSGGQRQRIAIARALMAEPHLVICDEPTSALDLSVQAHILNLLQALQEEFALSYLFISHDLSVVRHIADRIVVLYRGRVVEQGDARTIYANPCHPYTQALLAAAPVPHPEIQRNRRQQRQVAVTARASDGTDAACAFAPRCPYALDLCWTTRPLLEPTSSDGLAACHRRHEIEALPSPSVNSVLVNDLRVLE